MKISLVIVLLKYILVSLLLVRVVPFTFELVMISQKMRLKLEDVKFDRGLMLRAIQLLDTLIQGPDPVTDPEACDKYGTAMDYLDQYASCAQLYQSRDALNQAVNIIQSGMDDEYLYKILALNARSALRYQRRHLIHKGPLNRLLLIMS